MSKLAPGDPVELRLGGGAASGQSGQIAEKLAGDKAYLDMSESMGLHLPNFYFNLSSRAFPDTLYKVPKRHERKTLNKLTSEYGNWPEISDYWKSNKKFEKDLLRLKQSDETYSRVRTIREVLNELYREYDPEEIQRKLKQIDENVNHEFEVTEITERYNEAGDTIIDTIKQNRQLLAPLFASNDKLKSNWASVLSNKSIGKKFIPSIKWYGLKNQYHRWIFGDIPWFKKNTDIKKTSKGMLRGDLGVSYADGRKVNKVLGEGIRKTMWLSIISIILVYLISIPLGIIQAIKKDSIFDRLTTFMLFIFFSLPGFWIATMLVVFITTDQYGEFWDWFPTYGWSDYPEGSGFFKRIGNIAYHLVLPIFCLTYGGTAFIARQMRGGMVGTLKQDFIRTAKAKGLANKVIILKHALRNSLIPIVTMFASLFPRLIGGGVVLELIFSIQGMGLISYQAILGRNWPIVFAVLMLSAILTLIGILVSDIFYSVVDPRISFTKKA